MKKKLIMIISVLTILTLCGCSSKPRGAKEVQITTYKPNGEEEIITATDFLYISERKISITLMDGTEIMYCGDYKIVPIYD